MNKVSFDKALGSAQEWVGKNGIYAVGESESKSGKKIILVFAIDPKNLKGEIPCIFKGYIVQFYETGEIVPQINEQEE